MAKSQHTHTVAGRNTLDPSDLLANWRRKWQCRIRRPSASLKLLFVTSKNWKHENTYYRQQLKFCFTQFQIYVTYTYVYASICIIVQILLFVQWHGQVRLAASSLVWRRNVTGTSDVTTGRLKYVFPFFQDLQNINMPIGINKWYNLDANNCDIHVLEIVGKCIIDYYGTIAGTKIFIQTKFWYFDILTFTENITIFFYKLNTNSS